MTCARLRPHVRRVSSHTFALKRACGAMRRRGSFPPAEARNLRTLGLAARALGLVDLQLETLFEELFDADYGLRSLLPFLARMQALSLLSIVSRLSTLVPAARRRPTLTVSA